MKPYVLARASFTDAVLKGTLRDINTEDILVTAVHLPVWIRMCVTILQEEHNISKSHLYTNMVNHGTSMIQIKHGKTIKKVSKSRIAMINSDNAYVSDIAMNYSFDIDGLGKGGKRTTIRVPTWCKNVLGKFSSTGLLNHSSMIRLAICFSLSKNFSIREDRLKLANAQVDGFNNKFQDYIDFCNMVLI